MLKLIPTPMQVTYGGTFRLSSSQITLRIEGEHTPEIRYAVRLFEKQTGLHAAETAGDALLVLDCPCEGEDEFFAQKNAAEQGYILDVAQGRIRAAARSGVGCIYALATLAQLVERTEDGFLFNEASVRDYPSFSYRGVSWTVCCEIQVLSYDRGDGEEQYIRRFLGKLDTMAAYKINVVYTDGFGWDPDRSPGYAERNRLLNDEARLRGIRLVYGGYGMSYGMALSFNYSGVVHMNRRSYPDGEIYDCLGLTGRDRGTCMSNPALTENKCAELQNFVRKVHPGALYIHNMDYPLNPDIWANRCESCRKSWPDDRLDSPRGMAGAFAAYLNALIAAVRSVRDGDYDGKDCLMMFVSPGYMGPKTGNAEFERTADFWLAVDRLLKDGRNAFIGHGCLFETHQGMGRLEYLRKMEKNVRPAVLSFNGSDNFFNDQLFVGTAVLCAWLKGAEWMICFNGKAGSEPLALTDAEYLWNCDGSSFCRIDAIDENAFRSTWFCANNLETMRPAGIYGPDGLMETACKKLWGEKRGAALAEIYRLGGDGCPPVLYMSNVEMGSPLAYICSIDQLNVTWARKLPKRLRSDVCMKYQLMEEATQKAAAIARENADGDEDILWMAERFETNARILRLFVRYTALYAGLDDRFDRGEETKSFEPAVTALHKDAAALRQQLQALPWDGVDANGGSRINMGFMCEAIEYFTLLMLNSIETGDRKPHNQKTFKKFQWG